MWSCAGCPKCGSVSQLIVRGAIRRELPDTWYFVVAPVVTASWTVSEQSWLCRSAAVSAGLFVSGLIPYLVVSGPT